MSYLGNTPAQQAFTPAVDFFDGTGSTTAFTLSRPVASVAQIQAVIENVPQKPGDAFTVNGNVITFTSAPPTGTQNIYVYYTSPITQVIAPSQGTVNVNSLSSGLAFTQWTTSGSNIYYNLGNVGIGTSSPSADSSLHVFAATDKARISVQRNGVSKAWFGQDGSGDAYIYNEASGAIRFYSGSTERAKITTDGQRQSTIIGGGGPMWNAYDCRAWVNFNGLGGIAVNGSANISSVTRTSAGTYTVNFSTAMPNTGYSAIASAENGSGYSYMIASTLYYYSTNVQVITAQPSSAVADARTCSLAIFQ